MGRAIPTVPGRRRLVFDAAAAGAGLLLGRRGLGSQTLTDEPDIVGPGAARAGYGGSTPTSLPWRPRCGPAVATSAWSTCPVAPTATSTSRRGARAAASAARSRTGAARWTSSGTRPGAWWPGCGRPIGRGDVGAATGHARQPAPRHRPGGPRRPRGRRVSGRLPAAGARQPGAGAPRRRGPSAGPGYLSLWTTERRRRAAGHLGGRRRRAEPVGAEHLRRSACGTATSRTTASSSAWSPSRWAPARSRAGGRRTAPGSARDVAGREVRPGGAQEHRDVDRLQPDAALDVAEQIGSR